MVWSVSSDGWLNSTKVVLRAPEENPFFSAHPSTIIPSRLQSRLFLITVIPGFQRGVSFWAPFEEVIDLIKEGVNVKKIDTPTNEGTAIRLAITCRSHRSYSSWFRLFFFPRTATLFHFRTLYSASSWSLSSLTQST